MSCACLREGAIVGSASPTHATPSQAHDAAGNETARSPGTGPKTASSASARAYHVPMTLHDDAAYRAISTHDARFDGRFFVGVTTTGIYCRPVCRVRLPRRENCRFFSQCRAAPRRDGFRPCLRCRPELAPGLSLMDSSQALAQQAARTIEQAAHDGSALSMPRLAARLGVTDRHLRRIFQQHVGVAPIDYLTTQRLLLAKQLLTDTPMPVTQVALASGFASLRRFNAAFSRALSHEPERRCAARGVDGDDDAQRAASATLRLRLAYRPPYSTTRCCASSRRARSMASKRSTARACAARWRCRIVAAC